MSTKPISWLRSQNNRAGLGVLFERSKAQRSEP